MRSPSREPVLPAQVARVKDLRLVNDDPGDGQTLGQGAVHQVRQEGAQAEDDQGLTRRFDGLGAPRRAGFSVSVSADRGSAAGFTLDVGCARTARRSGHGFGRQAAGYSAGAGQPRRHGETDRLVFWGHELRAVDHRQQASQRALVAAKNCC